MMRLGHFGIKDRFLQTLLVNPSVFHSHNALSSRSVESWKGPERLPTKGIGNVPANSRQAGGEFRVNSGVFKAFPTELQVFSLAPFLGRPFGRFQDRGVHEDEVPPEPQYCSDIRDFSRSPVLLCGEWLSAP